MDSFWSHFASCPATKLQRIIMDSIDSRTSDQILADSVSIIDKARLVSCKVKGSGTWLSVFPSSSSLSLLDSHYALAFRLRLGLPPQDDLPLFCKCGDPLAPDPNHFLSCKIFRRTIVTTRHDLIVRSLASFTRSAGGSVYIEPKFFGGRRPDAQVHFPSGSSSLDVSITHPAATSYAVMGSKLPLSVAKYREQAKHRSMTLRPE